MQRLRLSVDFGWEKSKRVVMKKIEEPETGDLVTQKARARSGGKNQGKGPQVSKEEEDYYIRPVVRRATEPLK